MKTIIKILSAAILLGVLSGCVSGGSAINQSNQAIAIQTQTSQSDLKTQWYVYPNLGMGDITQMKPQKGVFQFPMSVTESDDKAINVMVYQVDKESFFANAVGAFAAQEGALDLSKFRQKKLLFQGDLALIADRKFDEYKPANGHVELPMVEGRGFYYLEFRNINHKLVTDFAWHDLLEVTDTPTEFNYAN